MRPEPSSSSSSAKPTTRRSYQRACSLKLVREESLALIGEKAAFG